MSPRLAVLVGLAAALACSSRGDESASVLPEHRLGFVGDLFLGRRLNPVLHDPRARARMLADVASLTKGMDIMLGNAEGVIALGGDFFDKGESRPYTFRAHPKVIEVLAGAGFDVFTVGNNHGMDYGPAAFGEMLDRLRLAGMDYTGGGWTPEDAAMPAYRRVGDVVVAIVGADLTGTCRLRVGPRRPGTVCWNGKDASQHDAIVEALTRTLRAARRHAQVVILSPHLGKNRVERKSAEERRLGASLIEAGYDAILAHSAHVMQGVELVDGRPIVWDAGNFLVDYGGGGLSHESGVYEVAFDRRGVTRVVLHPASLEDGRTVRATAERAGKLLERVRKLSKELGTEMRVEGGNGVVRCDPGATLGPARASDPPERPAVTEVRLAPSDLYVGAVPSDARPLNVRYANGVTLLASKLLMSELPVPKSGNVVDVYLRAERALPPGLQIEILARLGRRDAATIHLPGDGMLPSEDLPPGRIVHDRCLMRLDFEPSGTVEFFVGLRQGRQRLSPVEGTALASIGSAPYRRGAAGIFATLRRLRAARP